MDGWERKQVGRGVAGDEAGDEWEESPEGGVRRKKSVKTKRKHLSIEPHMQEQNKLCCSHVTLLITCMCCLHSNL